MTAMAAATDAASTFDIWMQHQSDAVQHTTLAFGEREVLEAGMRTLVQCSPALQPVLRDIMKLYALYRLEADLGWFMAEEMVSPVVGRAVPALICELCASLAPYCKGLVESFGIPDHVVQAPIAGDWARYNTADNKGEVVGIPF